MRIISKQKDFYDYAASYGIDPSVVFIRTPRKVHIDRRNVDPVLKPFYIWPVDFSREKSCYVVHVHSVRVKAILGEIHADYCRLEPPSRPMLFSMTR